MSSKSQRELGSESKSDGFKVKIEVCVDSVESALAAIRGGADRLEICGNLAFGGGTTPSLGLLRLIKQSCPEHVELMVMVRPRTGDFLYSPHEISVMLEDIGTFADLRVTGVVFGALSADGSVDIRNTKWIVDEAVKYGMQVCFHRAFDMVNDQREALGALRAIPGITRILTSGGKPSAPAGLETLTSLFTSTSVAIKDSMIPSQLRTNQDARSLPSRDSQTTIEIMPGSGINATTVGPILRTLLPLGCCAVHLSGGAFVDSEMQYRPEGMGMGVGQGGPGEWGIWRTDEPAVRKVREIVDREWEAYMRE